MNSSALRTARIGVQIVGDDYANTPPVHALARRGIVRNVAGYRVTDDYAKPNPPARLIEAVAEGKIDVAIAWGPIAGFFSRQQSIPLMLTPVSPKTDLPSLPFVFNISIGVRRPANRLQRDLNAIIGENLGEIHAILKSYGVPLISSPTDR
jgi:mxaJ protein